MYVQIHMYKYIGGRGVQNVKHVQYRYSYVQYICTEYILCIRKREPTFKPKMLGRGLAMHANM